MSDTATTGHGPGATTAGGNDPEATASTTWSPNTEAANRHRRAGEPAAATGSPDSRRAPAAAPGSSETTQQVDTRRGGSAELVRADDSLDSAHLLRPLKKPPQSGWRGAVYTLSGGLINPGQSDADLARAELVASASQQLIGFSRIVVLSAKGGVGKTEVTTTLGSTLSMLRGDKVIGLDANPDRGNLVERVPRETAATVRTLLRDLDQYPESISRYSDIRTYTSQSPARLEVLASDQDPALSRAFSGEDYLRTVDLLSQYYTLILTDCGTGLLNGALLSALQVADQLVIVSSGSIDGARAAQGTIEFLEAHGHRDLVARSVTVINHTRPQSAAIDLDRVEKWFAGHTRDVRQLPFDPHIAQGSEIDLGQLREPTRYALLELAASVAGDFPRVSKLYRDQHRRRTPAVVHGERDEPR